MTDGYARGAEKPRVRLGDRAVQVTLRTLAAGEGPVGVWRVRDALRAAGIEVSEATVGRLLRELDYLGLSERVGVKSGRVLTSEGRRELAALEQAQREDANRDQFLRAIRAESAEDILDLLHIRRAVEVETARLAALRASEDDLARLAVAVREHQRAVAQGGPATEESIRIHLLIARASGSRAAEAVLRLILQNRQVLKAQMDMQRQVGWVVPQEHEWLLEAIKQRQPQEAAEGMRAHIDRLIEAVERFAASRATAGAGA